MTTTKTRDAVQVAQAVKRALVDTGCPLNPKYVYVLGYEPIVQGDPPQPMSLRSHGWGDKGDNFGDPKEYGGYEPYAELVAEEWPEDLVEQVCGQVAGAGTWDVVQSGVWCFYGDEGGW